MKSLIRHIILNPILVNIAILLLIIFGIVGLKNMKSNFFTPLKPAIMRIIVAYPGASAKEVEESIIITIENNLKGVPGIYRTKSIASENSAMIIIEFEKQANQDDVVEDVKNAVNIINTFPKGAEKPIIYKEPYTDPAATLNIVGDLPLAELKNKAQKIEKDLTAIDGISLVELVGLPEEEIHIYIKPESISPLGLTLTDISSKIANENIEYTAGTIKTYDQTIQIRSLPKKKTAQELARIIVYQQGNTLLRLGDIATVQDSWSDDGELNFYNKQRSIEIKIDKTMTEDLLEMIQSIETYVKSYNETYQETQLVFTSNRSNVLKQRIDLLTKNGMFGFFLIIGCLTLFISFRLSFWVAVSIPLSFLGFFIIGNLVGITINVISLFGLIVVIGILVDDGIIISENIYQHAEKGKSPLQAAVDGVTEVLPSITAAITTTIVAFSPFYFLDGISSKILSDIASVVIITLLVSLIECIFFLPTHLAYSSVLRISKPSPFKKKIEQVIQTIKMVYFKGLLTWCLSHRLTTFIVPIALILTTFLAIKTGIIKATLFPYIDSDQTRVQVTMEPGTNHSQTLAVLDQIETHIPALNSHFKAIQKNNKDIVLSTSKTVSKTGDSGTLVIELLDGETRDIESASITEFLREKTGKIPKAQSLTFGSRNVFGKPIVIALKSTNTDQLLKATSKIKESISQYDAIKDISDAAPSGGLEASVTFSDTLYQLGLQKNDVMQQLRHAFYGLNSQILQKGINDIEVRVILNNSNKNSIEDLLHFKIQLPNNQLVPLASIASISFSNGPREITRVNGMRQLDIEANLTQAKDPLPPILSTLQTNYIEPILLSYPDVTFQFEGQQLEQSKMNKTMPVVMSITLITMFAIIASGFGSFYQTLFIFFLIPFGFIGVAWGHWIHNMPLNVMSTYGIIALIGIIVNDSIVLINTYNRLLTEGKTVYNAIVEASLSRFRPIILTSITTVAGLSPLILETSRQAQFLIPMAISISYGLTIMTLFILILLPTMVITSNKLNLWIVYKLKKTKPSPESLEPPIKRMEKQHAIQH